MSLACLPVLSLYPKKLLLWAVNLRLRHAMSSVVLWLPEQHEPEGKETASGLRQSSYRVHEIVKVKEIEITVVEIARSKPGLN